LIALAAATVALAQEHTTPQPQTQPPASTQSQTPADRNASTSGESAKQELMKSCFTQVRTANPGVPEKDIKDFCTKEVNSSYAPHD
jgi:hypothetical protein